MTMFRTNACAHMDASPLTAYLQRLLWECAELGLGRSYLRYQQQHRPHSLWLVLNVAQRGVHDSCDGQVGYHRHLSCNSLGRNHKEGVLFVGLVRLNFLATACSTLRTWSTTVPISTLAWEATTST